MSDEDRDIDIETDEDEDDQSGSLTSSAGVNDPTQFMTASEKRAHHNALERKRRDHIKESFQGLRDAVPALHGEKARSVSRAQILKKASEYIQFMRRKNHAHNQDLDDLRRQNTVLESQIRALEKAKVAGTFAAQSSTKKLESGSESSDIDTTTTGRRKRLKTK